MRTYKEFRANMRRSYTFQRIRNENTIKSLVLKGEKCRIINNLFNLKVACRVRAADLSFKDT